MSVPSVPDWLKTRDGSLKQGVGPHAVFVMLGGQPQYRLDAHPAGGQYVCGVTQTNNGRQVGDATKHPTADAALAGGLTALRARLGW